MRALENAEKVVSEIGRDISPGITGAESMRALATGDKHFFAPAMGAGAGQNTVKPPSLWTTRHPTGNTRLISIHRNADELCAPADN